MKKKPRTLKFIKRLTLKWFIPGTGNYISNQKQTQYNEKFRKKNILWFLLNVMFNRFIMNLIKLRINNQELLT